MLHPMSSPTLSNDSLASPHGTAGLSKHIVQAENEASLKNEQQDVAKAKENLRPDYGCENFRASLRDLSMLEKQLDAALGIHAEPLHCKNKQDEGEKQSIEVEARDLKARLHKAENDLRSAFPLCDISASE